MNRIRDVFSKQIDRKIEEVIKVDQADEATVRDEISEYVATDAIKDHFRMVFQAVADAPTSPHEGIGVWVSGFFGSGKSSFAKILGYTLAAKTVCGASASDLFLESIKDKDSKIADLLRFINTRIPTDAVIFDVSMDRGVRVANERITEIMYKALLRQLSYPEDFDLAQLEITLEGDGLLDDFCQRFQSRFGTAWKTRRKLDLAINEASAVLHDLKPQVFSAADSWARSIGQGRADITAKLLAERAFELVERRRPGRALVFVIDEVGQYVSRSVQKMLDLQGVVQAFGIEGKNRVKAKKAVGPCWIVVTSQEKLNEVVDALDERKIELARLQDRFPITIDLKQSDISEVTSKRVLDKSPSGKQALADLYDRNEGRLKTFCTLERTSRNLALKKHDFVSLYPYLPYQIELCIDIVAGLRLRRGAQRHIGGSNRTIIKQAQQMLVHPRTQLAEALYGTLVTLDRVYELLYAGNLLPSEVSREVDEVAKRLPGSPMSNRVAKAIALLEVVRDLPRTAHNIAVCLHPAVEANSSIDEVKTALTELEKAQFVREAEDGYKLLTAQEKNWDTRRNGFYPKPADRNRLKRELIGETFSDPKLRTYRYKNLRQFKLSVFVDGESIVSDGNVPINILTTDEGEDWNARCKEARASSNEKKNEIFWVVSLPDAIHKLIEELFRSREMVTENERLATLGKLTSEESACLAEEKIRRDRVQRDLRSKLSERLQIGTAFSRGVQKDGSALGQTLTEVMSGILEYCIPDLYPKLEMGARHLKGDEPEKFLSAANLNGLAPVFYDGEAGLSLVTKQGAKFVPNVAAEICKEVLDYAKREHSYGNKVTGKLLESHFEGIGYGWDRDILRLILAVLLRGGAIEVTHQGRKYRNHNDPASREPFTNNNAFRSASFAPREALDLKMLTDAARHYEEITGKEVDIEEGAIAQAFLHLATQDREQLLPLEARMRVLGLPGLSRVTDFKDTVDGILEMPADDCVKTLAGEGNTYLEARTRIRKLTEATTSGKVEVIRQARKVLETQWSVLKPDADQATVEMADELKRNLESETFYEEEAAIQKASNYLSVRYGAAYSKTHSVRAEVYAAALEDIKGLTDWAALCQNPDVDQPTRDAIIGPLLGRATEDLELPQGSDVCARCRATLPQMESDISAVDAIKSQVLRRLQTVLAPQEKIAHVRVSQFFVGKMETAEDIDVALGRLREHLLKLLAEGSKVFLD